MTETAKAAFARINDEGPDRNGKLLIEAAIAMGFKRNADGDLVCTDRQLFEFIAACAASIIDKCRSQEPRDNGL